MCIRKNVWYIYISELYYPSITEDLFYRAILWGKSLITFPDEDITIIKHAGKFIIYCCYQKGCP